MLPEIDNMMTHVYINQKFCVVETVTFNVFQEIKTLLDDTKNASDLECFSVIRTSCDDNMFLALSYENSLHSKTIFVKGCRITIKDAKRILSFCSTYGKVTFHCIKSMEDSIFCCKVPPNQNWILQSICMDVEFFSFLVSL